jgi:ferritin-like metal-binding protein YciE
METRDAIITYLQDAEAAERNFEDALAAFGKQGEQQPVKSAMEWMSRKARTQHERLESRLRDLGGSPSTAKSALAHMLAFTPTAAQLGHSAGEKDTQHVMITYAAAAAEMAMYEAMAAAAGATGDAETERLARQLQSEEKEDYDKAWGLLRESALASFTALTTR